MAPSRPLGCRQFLLLAAVALATVSGKWVASATDRGGCKPWSGVCGLAWPPAGHGGLYAVCPPASVSTTACPTTSRGSRQDDRDAKDKDEND
eukprot:CAMPEP_0171076200 /NCGR_PEP_ID=MMETSP0766_2-20121228/13265_1 /TAXON_ID=439317 /ORGANISM="Gambierdiscus australes, Strain CAWD 149" /LENGTH=91 /DNA_ID=CAMNT_0011533147 /DNA_START=18 /DNA_END=291 /DNA_ORIENTATION=+